MRKGDFDKLVEFTNVGGGLVPANQNAEELLEQSVRGEIFTFKEITHRDLKFHRCYFSLLGYIYDFLPPSFKQKLPKSHFYQFVKYLKGEYIVIFTFKDGMKMIEYESIAFGNMSEKRFHEYIKSQMPFIYNDVIGAFFSGKIYDGIVATIESEYEKFFDKL